MILGPVSYLDCVVFCVFLAPQLIIHVGLFGTVACVLRMLPFLLVRLPLDFLHGRLVAKSADVSPYARQATPFEDFVIRCVRYAFANLPAHIGRVFLSKQVALPWLTFRVLRHGYAKPPVHLREYRSPDQNFSGIWIIQDPQKRPDIVVYYVHGGGFSMGSTYFYLEFLMTLHSLLREAGYENPSIFGLEYTLVPDASFPTQLEEAAAAYEHVVEMAGGPSTVVLAGDSAGGTIILSLLLRLGSRNGDAAHGGAATAEKSGKQELGPPGMAVLISPWATLITPEHSNTDSDFLDSATLHEFGLEYADGSRSIQDPLVSPGSCRDPLWWRRASPTRGTLILYGEEELLAPDVRRLARTLYDAGVKVTCHGEEAGIHAWPVVSLFLSSDTTKRLKGMRLIVDGIRQLIEPKFGITDEPMKEKGEC